LVLEHRTETGVGERERERAVRTGGGLDRGRRAVRKSGELIML
jgi:hypothetical protein